MRRTDRQVSDPAQILNILTACKVCRLGLVIDSLAYILPLNFGFRQQASQLTLYFHSALEGRKVAALRSSPIVSFEMDCQHTLLTSAKACRYSFAYASIMGQGRLRFLETPAERTDALQQIILHQSGELLPIDPADLSNLLVYALEVTHLTAKARPATP